MAQAAQVIQLAAYRRKPAFEPNISLLELYGRFALESINTRRDFSEYVARCGAEEARILHDKIELSVGGLDHMRNLMAETTRRLRVALGDEEEPA